MRSSEIVSFSSGDAVPASPKPLINPSCATKCLSGNFFFFRSLFLALKADEKQMFVKLGGGSGVGLSLLLSFKHVTYCWAAGITPIHCALVLA